MLADCSSLLSTSEPTYRYSTECYCRAERTLYQQGIALASTLSLSEQLLTKAFSAYVCW